MAATNILELAIQVDNGQAVVSISQLNALIAAAGKNASATGPLGRNGMEDLEGGTRKAHEALRGIGEELGVHLPRFVSGFIAESKTVGPVLSQAFSTVAIVGFATVAGEALAHIAVEIVNYKSAI